jgi:muramidase (phage lysozyme)
MIRFKASLMAFVFSVVTGCGNGREADGSRLANARYSDSGTSIRISKDTVMQWDGSVKRACVIPSGSVLTTHEKPLVVGRLLSVTLDDASFSKSDERGKNARRRSGDVRWCSAISGVTDGQRVTIPRSDIDAAQVARGVPHLEGAQLEESQNKSAELLSQFTPNMRAFLDVIAYAEGTESHYNYSFTFRTFSSYSDHPRAVYCSGGYCSDAAGRYQFLSTTWDDVRTEIGVRTFVPANQDSGAMQLIKWRNAFAIVQNIKSFADFDEAIYRCSAEWASLPYSPYGQPRVSIKVLWNKFQSYRATY